MARTALFNWAFARRHGGAFVVRVEDTDSARDSEDSYRALVDTLRWMRLDWDEGVEVGGPDGPYRQSQRLGLYADVARRLRDARAAYDCFCTPDEVQARAIARGGAPGYDGHCRALADEQRERLQAEGRRPVLRFRMPDQDLQWEDLVRGKVRFGADQVPDYVLVRANGEPLYTLTNPVDDAMMRISHVLRGEDLMSSTPRQLALWQMLQVIGVAADWRPRYGHLPYVMGEGNKKLSKRDPQSSVGAFVRDGYLPEGLTNYLALLGWSLADDRDRFSIQEMAEHFDIARVSASPARFDVRKARALNADWIRLLPTEQLAERMVPFLCDAGLLPSEPSTEQYALLAAAVPLVQPRMETLVQGVSMLRFLFADDGIVIEPDAAPLLQSDDARTVLATATTALDALSDWQQERIEQALRRALVDDLGLKPKVAFTPVRVAVTGRRVSPPLFESLHLLGRERTLHRLAAAR